MSVERYSRLTLISDLGRERGARWWHCRCDCGNEVRVRSNNVKRGFTKSCGCLHAQSGRVNGKKGAKHGHTSSNGCSPEYTVWQGMIARCTNPKAPNYPKYGGAGIIVCDEWRTFSRFLSDMGPRPKGTTLDRRDGTKGYSKTNCRWATNREQSENRCTTRWVTIDGDTATVTEWARRSGLSDTALLYRIRRGISGSALLSPSRRSKTDKPMKGA